ncbi:Gfo/Idh/MocA family protein [Cohnella sp. GCM10027633]|uniref:Gfo/Idh/MocA family protein n=1 Tax=unclassified Cohnella TaxID=2636738 RepID=UPI00363E9E4D
MNPKKVNVAVIGVSGRGLSLMNCMADMDDVYIAVVSDIYEDRMEEAVQSVWLNRGYKPDTCGNYKEAVTRSDVDCVIIASSWATHREIAVAAMIAGKPVGMEAGGAYSVHELWELVRVSEETGASCMMLENCCYGREEMTILNMVKQGLFGELIHCQGGYQHDLRSEIAQGLEKRHYRFNNYRHRNGELYPTHEIGPIAQYLDINRGNRFTSLTSMSSKARGLNQWIVDNKGDDHEHAKVEFTQGDIVTTMIKCAHGETVFLIHDTSLPRVYSRGGRVQGTKAIWMEDKKSIHIEGRSPAEDPDNLEASWEPLESYMEQYEHPLWREYRNAGLKGGHGGMDFLVLRAFIESVMNDTPPPIDVYDTATWMAVTCLSEQSIALGSMPVAFPDFTCGKWIDRNEEQPSKYGLSKVVQPS